MNDETFLERHGTLLVLFLCVLIPLVLFGLLADEVADKHPFWFDQPIMAALHARSTPLFDSIMLGASIAGSTYGLLPFNLAIFGFCVWRRKMHAATFWVLATGGALLLNLLAKEFFQRTRPSFWQSIAPENSFSFPSGHAMCSMATAAALVVLFRRSQWRAHVTAIAVLFVLMVGMSRPYLGVHFPSDILAGWTAALAWVVGLALSGAHARRWREGRLVG
ncbi:phosphatase PAP2 family protein [Massilia sp. TSP1-1-2]|uniref:phosphatase PAP2 family protein n=1 Tax=Massilia sp. TSP1-1-2 TaxID=2804649 RepID=UPI003CF8E472